MDILTKAEEAIRKYNLIEKNDRILAAVSGGCDSVALLDVLCRLCQQYGIELYAAHVHHGLRETADRDAAFVEALCREKGVLCFTKHADVAAYAKEHNLSEELAGREIRYTFFRKLCKEQQIGKIATAHHKNDAAESICMHLIRGSGLAGLCGIPYARQDGVIRPLLGVEKTEIQQYCRERQLAWVEDETNQEPKYQRNQIRLKLIPEIQKLNPNFVETVTRNAEILAAEENFLHKAAMKAYIETVADFEIDLGKFQGLEEVLQRRVVQILYQNFQKAPQQLSAVHIAAVLSLANGNASGSRIELPDGVDARVSYGKLFFEKRIEKVEYDIALPIGERIKIPQTNAEIQITPCNDAGKNTKTKIYCTLPEEAQLHLRTRRQGDWFYPVGMAGRKKLSDYFTDMKIPRPRRDKIPLLFAGDDLVWVIGYRTDKRFFFQKDKKINYAVEIFGKM